MPLPAKKVSTLLIAKKTVIFFVYPGSKLLLLVIFFTALVHAYRGVDYIVAVHTNMGIEHQNETLKPERIKNIKKVFFLWMEKSPPTVLNVEECQADIQQYSQVTLDPPGKKRTKSRILQIHCRTILKEVTNGT